MMTSAMSIYNEILRTHPEYLPILIRGFHYDLRGEGVDLGEDVVEGHVLAEQAVAEARDRLGARPHHREVGARLGAPFEETSVVLCQRFRVVWRG
mgnify:CR=1 FL=1